MSRLILVVIILGLCIVSSLGDYTPCFTRNTRSIPPDHLMSTKTKPLVLGHRGNPKKYQENTLDGFKSLLQTNADGFELDIYLTKDNILVLFHDDNTQKLTGVNKIMWESTAEELTNIYVNKTLTFGEKVMTYDKPRPIPMLKDVLKAMKGSGKLMYLEIKPNRLRDKDESDKVGRAVAKMVTDMGLVKQAVINSFDPWKTFAAYQQNPDIPTGFFYNSKYCKPGAFQLLYQMASNLPDMAYCLKTAPNGTEFFRTMFKYGDVMKAINASFIDMHYSLYDNSACSNNTFQTFRKYYSSNISAGAYTLYGIPMSKEEDDGQDEVIDNLVKQGAERLITDDIDRMLTKLGRPKTPGGPTKDPNSPKAMATNAKPFFTVVFIAAILQIL